MPHTSTGSDSGTQNAAQRALSCDVLAAVVDASDDAIITESLDGQICTWSAGAERMLGFTAAEAIGRHSAGVLREEAAKTFADVRATLAQGGVAEPFETLFHRKDGEAVVVSVSVKALHDASGALVGVARVARNVTERK